MVSSIIFSIIGFVYSYYFYKDSKRNYEITIVLDGTFKKQNITYVYIWNSGNNTIYKENILNESKLLEVHVDDNARIEFAKKTDQTSDYFEVHLQNNYDVLNVDFDLLRPNEGFTLMLKTSQDTLTYWHLELKQSVKSLKFPKAFRPRGFTYAVSQITALLGLISLISTVVLAYVAGSLDFQNLNGFFDYAYAVMILGVLGFLIFAVPKTFKSLRAARPPMGLKIHFIEEYEKKSLNS